jgi:intracellular septation protein
VFFLACGALNLYVAFNFPEATWVNFKLFGLTGLTLAFALAQGFWIARKAQATESEQA